MNSIRIADGPAEWGDTIEVNNIPTFDDMGPDASTLEPGTFGSEYGRMIMLSKNTWIAVYTVYENNGLPHDPEGGTGLQLSISTDNCSTWEKYAALMEPGRNMDNGELIMLNNGDILLTCRSVRWWESYRINVYKSADNGRTWNFLSTVDQNEGPPGTMNNPPRGVYEPFISVLDNDELAIFYSNEKYSTADVPYSQIITERISIDNGATWSDETWIVYDPEFPDARPGMPVLTQMSNGLYILVFEDGEHDDYNIHYKISPDGKTWEDGFGTRIPDQNGAGYIIRLSNGTLMVTSSNSNVSFSCDNARTWITNVPPPFDGGFPDYYWKSCAQVAVDKIGILSATPRAVGGHKLDLRIGKIDLSEMTLPYFNDFSYGNAFGFTEFDGDWHAKHNRYVIENHSSGKTVVGSPAWDNYEIEADILVKSASFDAGIIFRVQNPGTELNQMQGYYAGLRADGIVLGVIDNGITVIAALDTSIAADSWHHLKVIASEADIQVFVDDMEQSQIHISDETLTSGLVGFRAEETTALFDNLLIKPVLS